jgi:hypothetical protein
LVINCMTTGSETLHEPIVCGNAMPVVMDWKGSMRMALVSKWYASIIY